MDDPARASPIGALLRGYPNRALRPGHNVMTLKTLSEMPREAAEAAIRRLCATVPMADGMTLCRVLGRYKMFADNADFGLSPHLMLDGFWEMWVTDAMLRSVRPGMVAVDVGANLGYFTFLLAEIVAPEGRVHAFEPNPRSLRLLARSVPLNTGGDRITLHPQPLGARSGEAVRLVIPPGEPKNAHLSNIPPTGQPGEAESHELLTVSLDDAMGEERVDFVKIDAEGAERQIWEGMQRIVARGQPMTIFLEFAADRYTAPDTFLAEFAAHGFRLARIDRRAGIVGVTERDVLSEPGHLDQMLALSR
jgi:FkbM family methyltransferase